MIPPLHIGVSLTRRSGSAQHFSYLIWIVALSAAFFTLFHPAYAPVCRLADFILSEPLSSTGLSLLASVGNELALVLAFLSGPGLYIVLSLAVAVALAVVYGFTLGWRRVAVKDVDLGFSDLPAGFDGFRIVQISDLHIGTYRRDPRVAERIVEKINSLDPDLVVFTGDLVNSSPDEVEPFADVLSRIESRSGVVSVLGNHDYCVYRRYENRRQQVEEINRLKKLQTERLGWRLLLNENMTLRRGSDGITIVGVENAGKGLVDHADLRRAMRGVDSDGFTIVLSHDPTHWRGEILGSTRAQLTLSGHTHAMQFRIGRLSPSRLLFKEWSGVYNEGERKLHVNPGTGSNVPFRLGAWAEINLITLRKTGA